jgi:hypothetical protein
MASQTLIEVPDVFFSAFYYPELYRELILDVRRRRDELGLTDENEYELHVQTIRAFALVGHLVNTHTDVAATELLIDSAGLLESVKRLLRLIGVETKSASPSAVDLLLTLSAVTSSDQVGFIPELAEFSTDSTPPIPFEALTAVDLDRTDRVSYVYALEQTQNGSDGVLSTTSPDIFSSATIALTSANLGDHLFLSNSAAGQGGEFRVTEVPTANTARLVKIPGSKAPAFQTETNLTWSLKSWSSDWSAEANGAGTPFTPWSATPSIGDLLYIGHKQMMPGEVTFALTSYASGITLVAEYYDAVLSKFYPKAVADDGDGTITLNIDTLLGSGVSRAGAEVVVENINTGVKEVLTSIYAGGENRVETLGSLGQTTISTSIKDYKITSEWVPLFNQSDATSNFTKDGALTYDLPQNTERSWREVDVNTLDGWWVRFRVVSSAGANPIFDEIDIDTGAQYMLVRVTQGETVGPQVLGSSSGHAGQTFSLPNSPYFDDSEVVEVDESGGGNWQPYTHAMNFLNSRTTSRHYMRAVDGDGVATLRFGDAITGKVPPAGTDNVRAQYRIGGDVNGNVGVGAVALNSDGTPGISSVSNPRSAVGWKAKDGATDADLNRLKRDAPAALRTRDTGSMGGDVERLALNWKNSDGVKPVARAVAFEEALGLKTVKLMVVGPGGQPLSADDKTALEEYFNGSRARRPPTSGVLLMNHEVSVFNYEPKVVAISATVTWQDGNAQTIRAALLNLLSPLAIESDGVTFIWQYNGFVSYSRVDHEIHSVSPNIVDIPALTINGASSSLKLTSNQLPITTASDISVSVQNPN